MINQDFRERSHIQQDTVNISTKAGTNLEVWERDTTNNVLHQEAGQGSNRQTPVQDNRQRITTSENSTNLNNRPPIPTFIENTIMQKVMFQVKDNFLFHKRDIHKKKEKVKRYRLTTWKNNT